MASKPDLPTPDQWQTAVNELTRLSDAELDAAIADVAVRFECDTPRGCSAILTAVATVRSQAIAAELEPGGWACADDAVFAADGSYIEQLDDECGLGDCYAADGSLLPEDLGLGSTEMEAE